MENTMTYERSNLNDSSDILILNEDHNCRKIYNTHTISNIWMTTQRPLNQVWSQRQETWWQNDGNNLKNIQELWY